MSTFLNNPLGRNVSEMDVSPNLGAYSGVEIVVDEETAYFAGSTSGRVLTIENPWGTQAQAEHILETLKGFTYQPFTATGALLDPAAEIGDGVTINQVYSGIFKLSRDFGALMVADLSAPQDEELDHEYPFEPQENREITRKFSAIASEFAIQSNEIAAKVSETGGSNSSVSWSLTSTAWTVKANGTEVFKVDRNGATVTGKITATSGKIGGFDIGTSAITYNKQTWGGTSVNGIYFGTSGLQIGRKPKNANDNASYFAASASGTIEARNLKLTGTLNIGGTDITAAALRSGAQSAYNNGSTWSGTSTAWSEATKQNATTYPEYFKAGLLSGTSITTNGLMSCGSLYTGGHYGTWKTVTIGGTTINYLGY